MTATPGKKFNGLKSPKSNYFKVPHEFLEYLPHLSEGSTKLALYIIRHTWGFSEYSEPKKITTDEFLRGRKRKDGSRMDSGAGVSERGITKWLSELEEIGLIRVVVDDRDKARIKKSYQMIIDNEEVYDGAEPDQCTPVHPQNMHLDPQSLRVCSAKIADRTEKDTVVRNIVNKSLPQRGKDNVIKGGFFSTEGEEKPTEEERLARKLYEGLAKKRKITVTPRMSLWSTQIKKFFEITSIEKEFFEKVIDEYVERIDEEYMPVAFSAQSFCEKFPKIVSALNRNRSRSSEDQISRVVKMFEERLNTRE